MSVPREPIAVVGIACRFPGARNLNEFWQLLLGGGDAITEVPKDRFDLELFYDPRPGTPGRTSTRFGGFLPDIDRFDADFFGIAPREAERLDPQQRLLLEVARGALDDGGQVTSRLSGSSTGVFVGMWLNDYEGRLFSDPAGVDFYMTTGSGRYAAAGRLSYVFGLQGPSLTVDTACSSSLAAVHLACQSLWSGESTAALAAAANVILQPHISVAYSQSQMLSPDGRCKFGDARADGYVRSEGAAALVLKPLSAALEDGDPVRALILGSAVNNDGATSGFMTSPGQGGQEDMLRKAYRHAGISPGQVRYVEAHGTGTRAGDPVELAALGAALSEGRPEGRPCAVGSVKTNIGHAEGAAGMAGLIKVVLALQHRTVPPSLHFEKPNPAIPWAELPLFVPTEAIPWPEVEGPAVAGVSAFGIAGTNAHVVLQEAPPDVDRSAPPARVLPLPVSAASPQALRDAVRGHRDYLDGLGGATSLSDISFTASVRRSHHPHRMLVVGETTAQMIERLEAFLAGETRSGLVSGRTQASLAGRVVFVFPGQGSQWLGMGRELVEREGAFRESIEQCDSVIRAEAGWSLLEELHADEARSRLGEIDVVQPTLFAVEVALAALWRAWGVEPAAVVGHSMGEVAAAHAAGILTLEDAVSIICRRSRLLRRTRGRGAMAVVELSLEETARALKGFEERLSVAVSNSSRSTVVSGDPGALDELIAELEAREVFCRRVKVDVASHSPQMDPLQPDLLAALGGLDPREGDVPLHSTVIGGLAVGSDMGPGYWARNLRQPVLFSPVVRRLRGEGHDVFIEMSPHPILLPAVQQDLQDGSAFLALPSGRRGESEQEVMLESLGLLHCTGGRVDWARLFPGGGRCVALPDYPWQRERFWHETPAVAPRAQSVVPRPDADGVSPNRPPAEDVLLEVVWREQPPVDPPGEAPVGQVLILADGGGLGTKVAHHLASAGARPVLVQAGEKWSQEDGVFEVVPDQADSWVRLAAAAWDSDWSRCTDILHLWSLDAPPLSGSPGPAHGPLVEDGCLGVLELVRHLASREERPMPRLWLITAGSQAVTDLAEAAAPRQAPIWGMGRVVDAELPQLRCTNVDLDADPGAKRARALAEAVLGGGLENQLALRSGRRFAPRLVPLEASGDQGARPRWRSPRLAAGQPLRARVRRPGSVEGIRLEPLRRSRPGPGEVEVEVEAAGLNYVNLLSVRGACPGYPNGVGPLGGDCAGRVSAVGEGVRSLRPGDRVMGVALDTLGSHVVTDARLLVPIPEGLDDGEAATVPIAFVTAHLALESLARVQPGERVLIHSAAGGVGLAALQLARRRGAQVIASAGSPERRELVRSLGVSAVVDSRSSDLASAVLEATGGVGVDVVLNSLAGELIEQSLSTLAPGGRFVELGKQDIYRGRPLDLGFFRKALAFFALDLDWLARERPEEVGRLLSEACELLARGEIEPLPHAAFPLSRLPDALQALAEGRHVGKVVVRPRDPEAQIDGPGVDAENLGRGTCLITGGLGALGLQTARRLVERGLRAVALVSRRPVGNRTEVEVLEAAGATVRVLQADVSRREDVEGVLDTIEREMPPLEGVIHAAGVLDDATLLAASPEQFRTVMAGKVDGALHLHELTAGRDLSFFVLYSSVAPLIGSEGQANYAAANAFLDALACYRRARGLPAIAISWGPWSGAGLAAADERRGARLAERGLSSLEPTMALDSLERILAEAPAQAVAARVDFERFREASPAVASWPLFSEFSVADGGDDSSPETLRESLLRTPPGRERRQLLEDGVRELLARVLRKAPTKLDPSTPFRSLGLDSLMGLELRNHLERGFGTPVPATLVWNHPTVDSLAPELARRAGIPLDEMGSESRDHDAAPAADLEQALAQIEQLSDEEARRLLAGDEPSGGRP